MVSGDASVSKTFLTLPTDGHRGFHDTVVHNESIMTLSSNTNPSNGLTIEEVLQVYLSAWNATINHLRPLSVTSFEEAGENGDKVIKINQDSRSRGCIPPKTSTERETAYKKLDQCDMFCWVMYETLSEHLQRIKKTYDRCFLEIFANRPTLEYDANVCWAVFTPRPVSTFAIEGSPIASRHSVLHILTNDDRSIIFDGTVEQFGWEASKAISSLEDFSAQCTLDGDGKDESCRARLRDYYIKFADGGYWCEAIPGLLELLRGTDWDSLAVMPAEARAEAIRSDADARAQNVADRLWG